MLEPLCNGSITPGFFLNFVCAPVLPYLLRVGNQTLRCVRFPVKQNVLYQFQEHRINLVVPGKLARIDDPHVHPRLNGMVKEGRVHGFAHRVVAPKGEREIRDASRDFRAGKVCLDPPDGLDIINGVAVVLGEARRDGEDVRVEDDVFGREADVVYEDAVGPLTDFGAALQRIGLPVLIKRHHDHSSSVITSGLSVLPELVFAFFERYRVDDGLTRQALQPCLDDVPLRRIHHDRHP